MHLFGETKNVKIRCADCPALLSTLAEASIEIRNITYLDALTVSALVRCADIRHIETLVLNKGGSIEENGGKQPFKHIRSIQKRPMLIIAVCCVLLLSLYLPGKIFFIHVEGNSAVPTRLILEKAKTCGIYFGASREDVRSEKAKNALIESLPKLKWVGVNTNGCVATINVREKSTEASDSVPYVVGSIVAVRDGIIDSCVATKGNPLCKVGQVVSEGDVLISGYTDCGIAIQATQAAGEVYALTNRELAVKAPAFCTKRNEPIYSNKQISIIIGKKRFYFLKDSGIPDISCGKIYKEYPLILPGGFRLPVAIVIETWYNHTTEEISLSEEIVLGDVERTAQRYLQSMMVSGEILNGDVSAYRNVDVYVLQGSYVCREMIGRVRNEESIVYNG